MGSRDSQSMAIKVGTGLVNICCQVSKICPCPSIPTHSSLLSQPYPNTALAAPLSPEPHPLPFLRTLPLPPIQSSSHNAHLSHTCDTHHHGLWSLCSVPIPTPFSAGGFYTIGSLLPGLSLALCLSSTEHMGPSHDGGCWDTARQ